MSAKDDEAAEYLSENNYSDAINNYRAQAKSPIFENNWDGYSGTNGEKLAERIRTGCERLSGGVVRFELLDPDGYDMLADALALPAEIYYEEYTYVGKGRGNYREDDSFRGEMTVNTCDETEIRDGVVEAIKEYCITAAAMAKNIGAAGEMRLFLRSLEKIEMFCFPGFESSGDGMGHTLADEVVSWIDRANRALWAQKQADDRLKRLKQEGKSAEPAVPQDVQAPTPAAGGACDFAVAIGAWARRFAEFDASNHTLVIKDNVRGKRTFRIPEEYGNAWLILKWLLESEDKDGWHVIDDNYANFRYSWRKQFKHNVKPNKDMYELERYIHCRKTAGARGRTAIRLTNHTKPTSKQKKMKGKRARNREKRGN